MRLIDADALKKYIDEARYPSDFCMLACELFEKWVDKQSTAYDVNKVVEELEEQYCCKNCEFADDIEHCPSGECAEKEVMNDIIKVIKRGGVEK